MTEPGSSTDWRGEPVEQSTSQTALVPAPPASPIAAALAGLDRLPELELGAHAEVYQHIHGELQRALAAIDDA